MSTTSAFAIAWKAKCQGSQEFPDFATGALALPSFVA
jgi:hypothetical protein